MGMAGVEFPIGSAAFFVEGRASGDFQLTRFKNRSGKNRLRFESLSGLTGMGGIRMRF